MKKLLFILLLIPSLFAVPNVSSRAGKTGVLTVEQYPEIKTISPYINVDPRVATRKNSKGEDISYTNYVVSSTAMADEDAPSIIGTMEIYFDNGDDSQLGFTVESFNTNRSFISSVVINSDDIKIDFVDRCNLTTDSRRTVFYQITPIQMTKNGDSSETINTKMDDIRIKLAVSSDTHTLKFYYYKASSKSSFKKLYVNLTIYYLRHE